MKIREIEAIEHLDFNPDFACESKWSNGEEAEWHVTMMCCGYSKLMCDEHKVKTQRFNETVEMPACKRCLRPTRQGAGMRFTPIRRGA